MRSVLSGDDPGTMRFRAECRRGASESQRWLRVGPPFSPNSKETAMPQYVVGVHDGHNATAAILREGELLFAVQEERLVGEKNFYGFPARSIKACLEFAAVAASDVSQLAFGTMRHTPARAQARDPRAVTRREASIAGSLRRLLVWQPIYRLHSSLGWDERQRAARAAGFAAEQCQRYDHHLGHAATAYFGMREDPETPYVVITLDGYGDLLCGSVSIAESGRLRRIAHTPFTDSLGTIYSYVTGAMGFTQLEHEYKLMGMAPYAAGAHAQEAAAALRKLISVDREDLRLRRHTPEPTFAMQRRLLRLISGMRFDNVCAGLQILCEDVVTDLVQAAVKQTGIRRVLCAGGIFMNVKANKRIMELTEVDFLGVPPSCGDESLAMGIAWHAHSVRSGADARPPVAPLRSAYLGPDFSEADAEAVIVASGHNYVRADDIESEIAELLAAGNPVARCAGRLEFGARALGNRSILADPTNLDLVRVINQMVKKRDFWMPFAPLVRAQRAGEYLNNPKNLPSPYMMMSFDTKENVGDLIAAVHNADLTARAQILSDGQNPPLSRILERFEEATGRGVLLNTSFNLHGYPIVLGPEEAMHVFDNSGLRYLALGTFLVEKAGG
ncbi:MAG: carbamoyltransferase C-terminal domain-containing protein [Solirubrobacteraceae bacterium]